ncbi:MAG: hypothetical protein ACRDXX_16740 [Stackebrandtia sp.]
MTDYDALIVTHDPELEALLRDRADQMSSQELAEYAHTLGLYPSGYAQGSNPPIAFAWPPDSDYDEPGLLIWDVGDGDEYQ